MDARGGAPGTRETDVLDPANMVRTCHALVFAGGSAFGLAAADGVMRYCANTTSAFRRARARSPSSPAPSSTTSGYRDPNGLPERRRGLRRRPRVRRAGAVAEGSVGAGTGATVGKLLGPEMAMKGGMGTASLLGPRGLVVGALAVSNALGNFFEPDSGQLIAAPREANGRLVPLAETMLRRTEKMHALLENTTLMCVATNAKLEAHQIHRLAMQAHDGFARVVAPAHTFGDGDVAFASAWAGSKSGPTTC